MLPHASRQTLVILNNVPAAKLQTLRVKDDANGFLSFQGKLSVQIGNSAAG